MTKTNYSALGEPILLRRDSGGRLLPISAEEAETQREREIATRLCTTLNEEGATAQRYSKSTDLASIRRTPGYAAMSRDSMRAGI